MTKELESSVTNATCVCFKSRECSEKIHYEYLLDRMERTLYNAISEMKRNNEVNKLVCQTKGQKDLWGNGSSGSLSTKWGLYAGSVKGCQQSKS